MTTFFDLNEEDIFVDDANETEVVMMLTQPHSRKLPVKLRLDERSTNCGKVLTKLRLLCLSIHRDRQKEKKKIVDYYNESTGEAEKYMSDKISDYCKTRLEDKTKEEKLVDDINVVQIVNYRKLI